jgi:NADPH:quinone reductase-like Zn-dependent oxidoreductase
MKIMRLNNSAQGPALVEGNIPQPQPGPDEVLIGVHAAGVTTTELQWRPTLYDKTGERRIGAVPGHEFSGVIVGAGKDAGYLEIGQEVFGMNDWFAQGATAEYCTAPCASVAPKPPGLTHIEAASIPIAGLTAWQGLLDHAKLQPGDRVLVHGGAGGVGIFAIQIARLTGAHVITTASARNLDFVISLGAEEVIDYQKSAFEDHVHDVDVVFDTVGGDTLERSWGVLKPGGHLVTVVSTAESATDQRVKEAFFIVEPNRKQLSEIGDLVESRRIRTFVDAVIPLSEASEAYTGGIKRQGRGKLVVAIAV